MAYKIYTTYQEEGKHYRVDVCDNHGLWMLYTEFGIGEMHASYSRVGLLGDDWLNRYKELGRLLYTGILGSNGCPSVPSYTSMKLKQDDLTKILSIAENKFRKDHIENICKKVNAFNNNYPAKTYTYSSEDFYFMLNELTRYMEEEGPSSIFDGDTGRHWNYLFHCEERESVDIRELHNNTFAKL